MKITKEKLILSKNKLGGTIPENIFRRVTRLTELILYENDFAGQLPSSVGNLKDIRKYSLLVTFGESVLSPPLFLCLADSFFLTFLFPYYFFFCPPPPNQKNQNSKTT